MLNRNAAARKIQKLFRRKRVFTNVQVGWRMSKVTMTTSIVAFKVDIDFQTLFDKKPMGGIVELAGYRARGQKPVARYVSGNLIGETDGIKRAVAKVGQRTVIFSSNSIDIMGPGNYEPALLACVKNGWVPKSILKNAPKYTKIDGKFNINKDLNLEGLRTELKKLPDSMLDGVAPFNPEIFPALVLKLKKPKLTYQFFENGNVLFTGLKDPADLEVPKELFRQFFTTWNLIPSKCIELGNLPKTVLPVAGRGKKLKLAARYEFAGRWNALLKPPAGYYIRPGTNGAARFYAYRKMEKRASGEYVNTGPMNLKGVGPKVIKAFKNAGRPIPNATLRAFANAGHPLNINSSPKSAAALKNRRAPSWNATKPGFYVRPGPGQQPYWFKIPKGVVSGRKTVIETYRRAGRNIPASVRNIFKISNSVEINKFKNHRVVVGINGILRINNKQATRLTKPELLAIARNMNVAQANAKMSPGRIISFIQRAAGIKPGERAAKNYHVQLGNTKYKLLLNFRVEKTVGTQRTAREWATLSVNEQKAIANALVPANSREEFNAMSKKDKYGVLHALARAKKTPSPASQKSTSTASTASSVNLGNFGRELEWHSKIENALGKNYFKNENTQAFLARLNALPSGSRGKPLKTNINKTFKTFVRETQMARRGNIIRANYETKIQVPNWVPNNKKAGFKKTMLNLATSANAKGKYPIQKNIKEGVRAWLNAQIPKAGRAAYNKENMMSGKVIHVPAWNPPKNMKFEVPKRLSPSKPKKKSPVAPKKPRAKKNISLDKKYIIPIANNVSNLGNAMIAAKLNVRSAYSWNELVRAGVSARFKNTWITHVTRT